MRSLIPVAALAALTACNSREAEIGPVKTYEAREVEIIQIDPPKHFHVNVRDVQSGDVIEYAASAKRCYGYDRYKVGDKVTVPFAVHEKNGVQTRILDSYALLELICQG